jgi:hypothetical protein
VIDPDGNLPARQPFILSGFLIFAAEKSDVRPLDYALFK